MKPETEKNKPVENAAAPKKAPGNDTPGEDEDEAA